jgi:farnesyl-diphosphate farnesyltransferase
MTNILKDIWEDRARGFCWLPRDQFADPDFDLEHLAPGITRETFERGVVRLVAITHGHLRNALRYTLLIPAQETGIRNFCLWALGMAVLTLRKIHRRPDFSSGEEVKISRRSVKATVAVSRFAAGHDLALRALFRLASTGLPSVPADPFMPSQGAKTDEPLRQTSALEQADRVDEPIERAKRVPLARQRADG